MSNNVLVSDIDIPRYSKSAGNIKKFSPMMFLKPNKPGEFYRFRLLNIDGSEVGRDGPFIERHIHDHWAVNEKGYKLPDDSVTCLRTAYVDYPAKQKKTDCPMCNHADKNWGILKNSGFKDPVARDKFNAMKSKYEYIVAAYVVKDPNADPEKDYTTGRCKTFMFTKKNRGKKDPSDELCSSDFESIIRDEIVKAKASAAAGHPYTIWNGKNAVDLCIQVTAKTTVAHPGEANEYKFTNKYINKIWFSKTPYDIPGITNELVKDLDFNQFYTTSTPQEIEAFYKKYYASASSGIPDEVIEIPDDPIPSSVVDKIENEVIENPKIPEETSDVSDVNLDDLETKNDVGESVIDDDPVKTDVDKDLDNILDEIT